MKRLPTIQQLCELLTDDELIKYINVFGDHFDLNNRGISRYGKYNKVNVRVSNHIPKVHNLEEYKNTLVVANDGTIKMYFILIGMPDVDYEDDEYEISEYMSEIMDKQVEVKIESYNSADNDDINYAESVMDRM